MYENRSSSGVRSGKKSGSLRKGSAPKLVSAASSHHNQEVEQSNSGMYSDQLGVSKKRPVRERLHGVPDALPLGRQSISKRQKQDDGKWKHDLFDDEDGDTSGIDGPSRTQDLRSRLTRQNPLRSGGGGGSLAPPVKDLRETLSGPIPAPKAQPEKARRLPSIVRASTASASVAPPRPVMARSNPPPPKIQKAPEQNVASFLTSLGLEKYCLTFQAEEVDMTALRHMREDDLKELNVPMGPRKKILLALSARQSTV